ncbi:capsular polysaccharide synthesis protein [Roseateles amylovorans]|uniref:Glycosyltransferase n=1 Tax=Roseateles amylovorans TaxID=2978473 RepID=A0ABY6B4H7_9BURK|nr:capsular polysaccharide synthesis protein [Roseateles amylovorans]UXH79177.1 glycosyltransferase [Roseateles amylovorans]
MPSTLQDFHNLHAGETVMVCGCGVSLNELDRIDPQRRPLTIGVNDVGRRVDPDYLVVLNPSSQFKDDRFRYVAQSRARALFTQLELGPVQPQVVGFRLGQHGGTATDATDALPFTQNSPYVAVCLAAYMGARRIGLIGVDFTDDHFFARTGRHVLAPRLREIDAQYGRLAAALAQRGIELVNLSARSLLERVPKSDLAPWIDGSGLAPSAAASTAARSMSMTAADRAGAKTASTSGLRIVSYSTMPVAGVPAVLARCIDHETPDAASCVWATGSYGNGVQFDGGVSWRSQPQQAQTLLAEADLVIVHNGKIEAAHRRVLQSKPILTMAHNYGWNVDFQFIRAGHPGVVVGQYQATLPEFAGWTVVPNPIPLWDPVHAPETPQGRGPGIGIAYTPSGRYERYPPGHRLYWHGKGFDSTMRTLDRLARLPGVRLETTRGGQVSHLQSMAMKRRSHIVIDECVTGSYHRNSLEGLAVGAVVVNGMGQLPGVREAFLRCAGEGVDDTCIDALFECATLASLPARLEALVAMGPEALVELGRRRRAWMETHWRFETQWQTQWRPAIDRAMNGPYRGASAVAVGMVSAALPPPFERPSAFRPDSATARALGVTRRPEVPIARRPALPVARHPAPPAARPLALAPLPAMPPRPRQRGLPARGSVPVPSGPIHTARVARPIRQETPMAALPVQPVSVIIPHGGTKRLPHLTTTLSTLRQMGEALELIVVELGGAPVAIEVSRRWADKHLFIEHHGPFERARALNAGEPVAAGELLLWLDNDLMVPAGLITAAVQELRKRRLDGLTSPFSTVRYLSEGDSLQVMQGIVDPGDCRPVKVLTPAGGASGNATLVTRDFVRRHGGLVEGFIGWGGEDNAWNHKLAVLGRSGRLQQSEHHLHHLFHLNSGGHVGVAAGAANPHYAANVELMRRVFAVRGKAQFLATFPPVPATRGRLTTFDQQPANAAPAVSTTADVPVTAETVWAYWEGDCPDWITACLRTLRSAAPTLRLLNAASFDQLRDQDRDIDLNRLQVAHRADFIRLFLLQRYGGLWVDADCVAMQPLAPVLALLGAHELVGHRERSGLVSNGFLAARPDSRILRATYARVCALLRSRQPLGWTSIGSEPLTAAVQQHPHDWHELPVARVQPICWSQPQRFFEVGSAEAHQRALDPQALCYMLSNTEISRYAARDRSVDLMRPDSFFSFLLAHAAGAVDTAGMVASEHRGAATMRIPETSAPVGMNGHADTTDVAVAPSPLEAVFIRDAQVYRRYRDESISGPGSSLQQTRVLRARLPLVLAHLGASSLLDAPCGDFHWMRQVALGVAHYVGVDIMSAVIEAHQVRDRRPGREFVRADLLHGALPRCDAIFCRDLLPHLSFAEIATVLENFHRSGAIWLLTTTFTAERAPANADTEAGRWRPLSLHLEPFDFPAPVLLVNEHCSEGGGQFADKSLAVWRLADLPWDRLRALRYSQPDFLKRQNSTPQVAVMRPSAIG